MSRAEWLGMKEAGVRDWLFQNVVKRVSPGAAAQSRRQALAAIRGLASGEGQAALQTAGHPLSLRNIFVTEPALKELYGRHPALADKLYRAPLEELGEFVDDAGRQLVDPSQFRAAIEAFKADASRVYRGTLRLPGGPVASLPSKTAAPPSYARAQLVEERPTLHPTRPVQLEDRRTWPEEQQRAGRKITPGERPGLLRAPPALSESGRREYIARVMKSPAERALVAEQQPPAVLRREQPVDLAAMAPRPRRPARPAGGAPTLGVPLRGEVNPAELMAPNVEARAEAAGQSVPVQKALESLNLTEARWRAETPTGVEALNAGFTAEGSRRVLDRLIRRILQEEPQADFARLMYSAPGGYGQTIEVRDPGSPFAFTRVVNKPPVRFFRRDSGEWTAEPLVAEKKSSPMPAFQALQALLAQYQGPTAAAVRRSVVDPFLRAQGEFLAGSGQAVRQGLSDLLPDTATGLKADIMGLPVSDSAVGLSSGALATLLASHLFGADPPEDPLRKQSSDVCALSDPRAVAKLFNADSIEGQACRASLKIEVTRGHRRYEHEEPRPMSYGELSLVLNPADGDPWDVFIAPSSRASDDLKCVGWIPQAGSKNHKLILARDGRLTAMDRTVIAGIAQRVENYRKPVILEDENALEIEPRKWKPTVEERAEQRAVIARAKALEKEAQVLESGAFAKVAGRDMPDFLDQDRPEAVKDIYRALKREHPEMPAETKARIAARQGKPGKQKQGPPYKTPVKQAGILDALAEGLRSGVQAATATPLRAGLSAGLLGGSLGSIAGETHLKNRLLGPTAAIVDPDSVIRALLLLGSLPPEVQAQLQGDPQYFQQVRQAVQDEGNRQLVSQLGL